MLSAIYGEQFFHDCYFPLGEVIVPIKLNINLLAGGITSSGR